VVIDNTFQRNDDNWNRIYSYIIEECRELGKDMIYICWSLKRICVITWRL